MRTLLIACSLISALSSLAQPEAARIVPKNDPGNNWVLDPDDGFHFCFDGNQGAIISAKSNEIYDWIRFCNPIQSVHHSGDFLLVQSEFEGCLYDLENQKALYSSEYRGSAGIINKRKSQVYLAYENKLQLPPGTKSILLQQNAVNGIFKVVDLKGELEDSLAIFTKYPQQIRIKGNRIEVSGRVGHTSANGMAQLVVEEFDLKSKKIDRSMGELKLEPKEEISRPKPLKTYENKTLEVYFHEPSGNLVLYGAGSSEGGTVKSWNLYTGEFLWAVSVENNLSPIRGFSDSGELLGDYWLSNDSLESGVDFAVIDEIKDASGKLKFVKAIVRFNLRKKSKMVLRASERSTLNLDTLNTRYIDLRESNCPSISGTDFNLSFNRGSMNFDLVFPNPGAYLRFLCFGNGDWMICNEDGIWTGSENAWKWVNLVSKGELLLPETISNYRNDALIKSYF